MTVWKETVTMAVAAGILSVGLVSFWPRKDARVVGTTLPGSTSSMTTPTAAPGVPRVGDDEPPRVDVAVGTTQVPPVPDTRAGRTDGPAVVSARMGDPLSTEAIPGTALVTQAISARGTSPRPDLVARAEALFDNGDVAGARAWLEVADEAGDAEASFRLGETYDPSVLAEWKVVGMTSDVARARALYARAAEGGVVAASVRSGKLP